MEAKILTTTREADMEKTSRIFQVAVLLLSLLAATTAAAAEFTSDVIVAHKALNSLGFYSARGKNILTIDVGPNPHEMAMTADRRRVFITNNGVMRWMEDADGGNTVSIIDLVQRKKVGEISTGQFRRPHGIALDPLSGYLAVTCEKPDKLLIIDTFNNIILRSYDTGGSTSHNVVLDNGARWAYVTNITTNNVGAVNLETGRIVSIPVGEGPQDAVFSPDFNTLYVACSDSITLIDVRQKKAVGKIGIPAARIDITPDGSQLIAASRPKSMRFIDRISLKEIAIVSLPGDPYSISVSRDGKFAFTGAEEEDEIYVVSVGDHIIVRIIPMIEGAHPDPVLDIPAE